MGDTVEWPPMGELKVICGYKSVVMELRLAGP